MNFGTTFGNQSQQSSIFGGLGGAKSNTFGGFGQSSGSTFGSGNALGSGANTSFGQGLNTGSLTTSPFGNKDGGFANKPAGSPFNLSGGAGGNFSFSNSGFNASNNPSTAGSTGGSGFGFGSNPSNNSNPTFGFGSIGTGNAGTGLSQTSQSTPSVGFGSFGASSGFGSTQSGSTFGTNASSGTGSNLFGATGSAPFGSTTPSGGFGNTGTSLSTFNAAPAATGTTFGGLNSSTTTFGSGAFGTTGANPTAAQPFGGFGNFSAAKPAFSFGSTAGTTSTLGSTNPNPATSTWSFGQQASDSTKPFQLALPANNTFSFGGSTNTPSFQQPSSGFTTNMLSSAPTAFSFLAPYPSHQQQATDPDGVTFETKYKDLPANYKSDLDKIYSKFKEPTRNTLETIQRREGKAIDEIYDSLRQLSIVLSSFETEQINLEKQIKPFLDEVKLLYREFRISSQSGISLIRSRGSGSRYLLDEELPDKFYVHYLDQLMTRLRSCIQSIHYFEDQLEARARVLDSYRRDLKVFHEDNLSKSLLAASNATSASRGIDSQKSEDLIFNRGPYGQLLRVGPSHLLRLIKQQAETYTVVASEINFIHQETNEIKQLFLKFLQAKRNRDSRSSSAFLDDYNPFDLADRKEATEKRLQEEKLKLETEKLNPLPSAVVPQATNQLFSPASAATIPSTSSSNTTLPATSAFSFGNQSAQSNTTNLALPAAPSTSVAALDLATTANSSVANPGSTALSFGFPNASNTANTSSPFGGLNLSVNTMGSSLGKSGSVNDLTTKKKNKK